MATAAERYRKLLNTQNHSFIGDKLYPCPAEKHAKILALPIRPDDTLIVCYAKSGTHWLHRVLTLVNAEGDLDKAQHYTSFPLEVSPPHMPNASLEQAEKASSPRVLSTHLPFELCPDGVREGKCKVILIVRNPKDVAVSLFHFHQKMKGLGDFDKLSWADFAEVFLQPNTLIYGSWFDNVKNWLKHRDDANVMVVLYEDLKQDLTNGVLKLAKFLGRPMTDNRAAEIAGKCQFDAMRKEGQAEEKQGAINVTTFMRKGVVGDWKSTFTVAQNETFDEVYQREMNGVQLDITFE